MTVKVKIWSRTSPIPWAIECDLEEFKPKSIAEIIQYIEDSIKAIMEEGKVTV